MSVNRCGRPTKDDRFYLLVWRYGSRGQGLFYATSVHIRNAISAVKIASTAAPLRCLPLLLEIGHPLRDARCERRQEVVVHNLHHLRQHSFHVSNPTSYRRPLTGRLNC